MTKIFRPDEEHIPVPKDHRPNVDIFVRDGGILLVEDEIDGNCALIFCENPTQVKQ